MNNSNPDPNWYVDSGATAHLSSSSGILSPVFNHGIIPSSQIVVGNGQTLPVTQIGNASLSNNPNLSLKHVLVTPHLIKNLISVRKFTTDNHCSLEFDPFGFSVKDLKTRSEILRCNSQDGLYPFVPPQPTPTSKNRVHALTAAPPSSTTLWHRRLGHPVSRALRSLSANKFISINCRELSNTCHSCQLGKQSRLPFSSSLSFSTSPFDLIHCDLWTSPIASVTAHKLTPRSRPCVFLGYALQHRGYRCLDLETRKIIISRHVIFNENYFPFKNFRSQNNTDFEHFLEEIQTASFGPILPHNSAVPTTNQSHPNSRYPITKPRLALNGDSPPLSPFNSPSPSISTPVPTTSNSPTPNPTNSADLHSPNQINSSELINSQNPNPLNADPTPPTLPISPIHTSQSSPMTSAPKPQIPDNSHHMVTRGKSGISKPRTIFNLTSQIYPLPKNHKNAINCPQWFNSMKEEYDALIKNRTWDLVPRPIGANVITGKWLFRHKLDANGNLARYKSRWVARGYSQQEGIDFDETFSPVVKPTTVRTILSLAINRNWPIHQLDVKNAFLHGHLKEVVFVQQPPGFIDPKHPDYVCKLNKALYGLKQAPRAWYHRFAVFLGKLGFVSSKADTSLFIYRAGSQEAHLLVYVDDIILTASTSAFLHRIISDLSQELSMSDLGPLHYFLGVSVVRNSSGLHLSQAAYAKDIISHAGMSTCNPCKTPVDTNPKLSGSSGSPVSNPTEYRSLAGSLQYLTFTRPDIAYAVQQCCLHMHDPREVTSQPSSASCDMYKVLSTSVYT
ncbi:hypothetical protein V2J09_013348 [Rumex salicifolius]